MSDHCYFQVTYWLEQFAGEIVERLDDDHTQVRNPTLQPFAIFTKLGSEIISTRMAVKLSY